MIETRQALYFTVVAEELHFGRAARGCGLASHRLARPSASWSDNGV